MNGIQLSVVVPVYNEELGISNTLKKVSFFLEQKDYEWEIIVVDDGSSDNSSGEVKNFKSRHVKLERLDQNQGKGAAIRRGVEKASGKYILFTDSDLSVPIEFVDNIMVKLEEGHNVVIGSRRTAGAKIIKHQGWIRENMGKVYTLLSQIVTGANVTDFTCGFKGFESGAAKKIFSKSLVNRWAFDSEIIFLAKKFGYNLEEIPVDWVNREDSRVNSLGAAGFKSLMELLQVRVNDLSQKYD